MKKSEKVTYALLAVGTILFVIFHAIRDYQQQIHGLQSMFQEFAPAPPSPIRPERQNLWPTPLPAPPPVTTLKPLAVSPPPSLDDFRNFAGQYVTEWQWFTSIVLKKQTNGKADGVASLVNVDIQKTESVVHPVVFQCVIQMRGFLSEAPATTISQTEIRTQFTHDNNGWWPVAAFIRTTLNVSDPQSATGVESTEPIGAETALSMKAQGLLPQESVDAFVKGIEENQKK